MGIERVVERIEQKRRVHEMSAKVMMEIEKLEMQQMHIVGCTKENKELINNIREGIEENMEIIR